MPTTEVDKELAAAISAAKNKEHNFVIVAKGPSVVNLFVSKLPIKDAEVQKAKKEHGGNTVLRGRCHGEDGELVFSIAKETAIADKKLKDFITQATKLSVKPRFHVDQEIPDGGEEGTETETQETSDQESHSDSSVSSPPAHTTSDDLIASLKAIKPALEKVRDAGTSVSAEVKTLFAELAAMAAKKQFDEAGQKLVALKALLKRGLGELALKTAPQESGGTPGGLSPKFGQLWEQAKVDWEGAIDKINVQMEKLRVALLQENDPELKRIAEFGLNAITAGHRVPLQTVILELDAAGDKATKDLIDKAKTLVVDFHDHIETDDQVEACDDNPFEVPVAIRGTLDPALTKMEQALNQAFA